ncbi:cilia- and flagella-associated protein 107 [Lampris incognitus]|uniref:cilia- and flagella-associated protein 107 n=1 Tax=Lampris incognitus TaxID=2546036 RepID=UPI0024B48722|nr:cilia- and flagella-associated protein 107 [Lampris incognitus]
MKNDKWTQPGWKIEQKYSNKVLVGNWLDERLQFTREPTTANSTSRVDYRPHWDFKPDVSVRRATFRRAEGLPSKLIFGHHDTPSSHYLVSLYDESFGHRHNCALPPLRTWHPCSRAWQPERSDYQIPAPPTNFGLLESKKHCLEKEQSHPPPISVYRSEYQSYPLSALCQDRFARTPCMFSSYRHVANHNNKDLDVRQHVLLQVPHCRSDHLPPLPQA